jgi:hypothetical protein
MKKNQLIILFNIIMLITVLVLSCSKSNPINNQETVLNSKQYQEYCAKVIALKKNTINQSDFNKNIALIQEQYEKIFPKTPINKNITNPIPYIKGNLDNVPSQTQSAIITSKTHTSTSPVGIKSVTCDIKRPFFVQYYPSEADQYHNGVPSDQCCYFTVDVTAGETYTDPFVVIYKITNGNIWENRLIQNLQVVGWNDDYNGSVNSHIEKVNAGYNWGPNDCAIILVFPYNGEGTANVSIQAFGYYNSDHQGSPASYGVYRSYANIAVCGTAVWGDDYGYILPDGGNLVSDVPSGWAPYVANGACFITDNATWGATNWGNYIPYCNGDSYIWAFNLDAGVGTANDDYVGYGSACALDPFSNGSFPTGGWHYPNFVLLGGYSDGGTMRFLQMIGYKY